MKRKVNAMTNTSSISINLMNRITSNSLTKKDLSTLCKKVTCALKIRRDSLKSIDARLSYAGLSIIFCTNNDLVCCLTYDCFGKLSNKSITPSEDMFKKHNSSYTRIYGDSVFAKSPAKTLKNLPLWIKNYFNGHCPILDEYAAALKAILQFNNSSI